MPSDPSKVRDKLLGATPEVLDVAQHGRVPFDTLCALLAYDAPSHNNYEFRYLGRGRSESEVLLLVQKPGRLRVVKCGPSAEILQEYEKRTLGSQIESSFRATDFECPKNEINGFLSLSSSFANDSEEATTLRLALTNEGYHSTDIEDILGRLVPVIFKWSDCYIEAASPVRFPWGGQNVEDICKALASVGIPTDDLQAVARETYGFKVGTLKTSTGRCHGDLNVDNVLIGIAPDQPPQPCLIDFTWALEQFPPAHDWAKLERDIKLYVLRKHFHAEPESYKRLLELINRTPLESDFPYEGNPKECDVKCIAAIRAIRTRYLLEFKSYDQAYATVDYLYQSLCWNLAYLDTDEYLVAYPIEQSAIVLSAQQIFEELIKFLDERRTPRRLLENNWRYRGDPLPKAIASKSNPKTSQEQSLQSISSFRSEARIAGYIDTQAGLKAIYLDDIYIHRQIVEDAFNELADVYLSTPETFGLWLSIEGDAGHGKTSLLWQVLNMLEAKKCTVQAIQAQQLPIEPFEELQALASNHAAPRSIFVIDTLDLIVGLQDGKLSQILNTARSSGAMVISTCRRQELLSLAVHIRPDVTLDLPRYEIPEAEAAINRWVALYEEWSPERKGLQFHKIRNLLDQQRSVHELSFEPLILRMIFEAYYPSDIPDDINTQQIYDKFWTAKVLADRTVKSNEESYDRALLCGLLADLAVFGERHSENVSIRSLTSVCRINGISDPSSIIESLASSGALRYWQLKSSVGFFHQTFLEYVLAHHILTNVDPSARSTKIAMLLDSVSKNDLFRAPVVKQLLLQASIRDQKLFIGLATSLRHMDTPLAARLLLEVAGKGKLSDDFTNLIREWNQTEPELFHAVAIDVIRGYPSSRMYLGFEFLESMLDSSNLGKVLFACQRTFAPFAPKETLTFLVKAAKVSVGKSSAELSLLKSAILAVFATGESSALEFLFEILPRMSPGVQAGALEELAGLITDHNVAEVCPILEKAFERFFLNYENYPVDILFKLFRQIRQMNTSFIPPHREHESLEDDPARSLGISLMNARMSGAMNPSIATIEEGVGDLTSPDYLKRLKAAELLWTAAADHPEVLQGILAIPSHKLSDIQYTRAAFRAASGANDPIGLRKLLDRFPFPERGIGDSYRRIIEKMAGSDAEGTAQWLRAKISTAQSDEQIRQVMVAFQVLAEAKVEVFTKADIAQIVNLGFSDIEASHEIRRVFASGAGKIAEVDQKLARDIFVKIMRSGNREIIAASINSLYTVESASFVLEVTELLMSYMQRKNRYTPLGLMLDTISDSRIDIREAVLKRLIQPDYLAVVARIDDATVVSRLLQFARNTTTSQVQAALTLSSACQLSDRGNRPMYAAVLKNVCIYTSDQADYYKVLEGLMEVSTMHQGKIRNSLYSTLKRLDRVLPHRYAVETVLKEIISDPSRWEKRALRDLITAAMKMPSWTVQDSRKLIEKVNLPRDIQAILHSQRR